MLRKKILLLILLIFLLGKLSAQNLVMNPSFESVNLGSVQCSWYTSSAQFNAAINNWTMPTGGSTDIFHTSLATTCFCSPFSTHASSPGTQAPRTGSSMSAMFVYGNGGCSPYREYLQGRLSSAMIPGQQYCIEFYVSLADKSIYACNNIGVYFTTASFYNSSMCVYNVTPHVNYTGPIITDKTNWTLISLSFTPTQAYQYFTIGNFFYDVSTTTQNVGGTVSQTRYFIDDVDIHLCNTNPVITVNNATICQGQTATLTANSTVGGTTYSWSNGATTNPINVSPSTTTTYTVTGTTGTGGTGSATATVTVNPNPTVSVTASPAAVCQGQSSTLTASGASTYSWSHGLGTGSSVTVNPTTTTTYTVTGTSAAGCSATASVTVTVNPSPVVTISASPQSICTGQSSTLTASGASTYSWSNGLGSGNSKVVSPTVTTTYTVTGTNTNGCTGTASITVTVSNNPTLSITASPPVICSGQSSVLTASGATNYVWQPGNLNGSSVTVNPSTTTVYTVLGSSSAGCSGTASISLTVNPGPVINATALPQSVCPGGCSNLTASGATTYTWVPGNLSGTSVNVCPPTSTIYTVTGTLSGCTGSTSVQVNIFNQPVITVVASPSVICSGDCSNLSASGALTYSWEPGSLNGQTVQVCPLATTTYTLTGVSSDGCTATANVTLDVEPHPQLNVSASPQTICSGSCSMLSVNGASSYVWMPGSFTDSNVNVCPTQTTSYTVTGLSSAGCSSTAQISVTVIPPVTILTNVLPQNICAGQSAWISASGASSYNWQPGNMSGSYLEVFPNITTTYTVTGDVNGCTGTGLAVVNVYPYPEVTFASDITEGCEGMLVQFTFLSDSSDVYNWYWTFGDYYFDTIQNPQHIYEAAGVYDVTLTISTVYGCTSSLTVPEMITVHPNPYAEFTYTPDKTTILDPLFWFYEQCNGASIWNWNFGDTDPLTNISNYPNPTHMYSDTGKYLVTLVAISDFGCTDTARHIVEVDPDVMIYVPNAFTPNNDGKNSIFISKGDGIDLSTFEMRIYDRWGKQMLYTNDIEMGWDGNFNGKPAPQGIYTWYISFSDINNREHILKGIVTLVR